MPGPGYGQGLFNPDGPKNFAAAIRTIKDPLSDVVKGFQDMGTASKQALSDISSQLDALSQKASTFGQNLRGGGGGGGGGGGAAGPQWGPAPGAPNGGQTGGTQGNTSGWGGPVGGSDNQPADQNARQTTAPNGGQIPQPTTMAQRAAVALPAAVAGAAQGYIAQQMPAAMQAAAVSGQFAAQYGVSARAYQTVPRTAPGGGPQLTFSQQDWQSTQWDIANRLSAAPGSARYRQALQQNNMLMKLLPGIQSSDAAQAQTDIFSAPSINQFLGIGMNIRPWGREMPINQIDVQLGRQVAGGRMPTQQQVTSGFQAGGRYDVVARRFFGDPGTPGYEQFQNVMRTTAHYQATHPNATPDQITNMVANAKGQHQIGLDTAYTSQLKKISAQTSLESQTTPGIIGASKVLNDAATTFYNAVNRLVGGTAVGRAGAYGVGAGTTFMGNPVVGTAASLIGSFLGGGGGGAGGGGSPLAMLAGGGGGGGGGNPLAMAAALAGGGDMAGGMGGGGGMGGAGPLGLGMLAGGASLWGFMKLNTLMAGGKPGIGRTLASWGGLFGPEVPLAYRSRGLIGQAWHDIPGKIPGATGWMWSRTAGKIPGAVGWLGAHAGAATARVGRDIGGATEAAAGGIATGAEKLAQTLESVGHSITSGLDKLFRGNLKAIEGLGKTLANTLGSMMKGLGGIGKGIGGFFSHAFHSIGSLFKDHSASAATLGGDSKGAAAAGSAAAVNAKQAWSASFGSATSTPTSLLGLFSKNQQSASSNNGGQNGTSGVGGGAITGGDLSDPTAWANAFLKGLNVPTNQQNVASLVHWQKVESTGAMGTGGPDDPMKTHNPLNTTQPGFGGTKIPSSSAGVMAYPDWQSGLQANLKVIQNGLYSDIVNALKAGTGLSQGTFPGLMKWGSGVTHLQRGTYNVAATQLALLHAGERVIPAADNFSMGARYQRLSSSGGGVTVHMHFKPNAIQLQVPANSTPNDMDAIAKQFVASLSKPQVLAGIRTS